MLNFGEIAKGRTKTSFLDGYNHSADTVRPVITGLPGYIDVNIAPAEVPPGQQFTLTFFCNTAKAPDLWGLNSAKAFIKADADASQGQPLEFITVLNEDFPVLRQNSWSVLREYRSVRRRLIWEALKRAVGQPLK